MARSRFFHCPSSRWLRLLGLPLLAAASAVAPGCKTSTGGTQPTPGLTLRLTPDSGGVTRGSAFELTATASGTGGYDGPITISLGTLPTGITGTVASLQSGLQASSAATTTVRITLSTSPSTSTTTHQITITATGSAVPSASAIFKLTVSLGGGGTTGSFSLSAEPSTVNLSPGGNGQATITITRAGGFTGSVGLAVSGAPAGLGAAMNPPSTTGGNSTLTLTAVATVTPGTYVLTITGTGAATPPTATTTVTVLVAAPSQVTLNLAGCPARWFAYQNGDGPWTRVAGNNQVYQFTINAGKGGWAWVRQAFDQVVVTFMTQEDLGSNPLAAICPPTKNVTVTMLGRGATEQAFVWLGYGFGLSLPGTPDIIPILGVWEGTHDLVAYRTGFPPAASPAATDRAVIIRDLNVPPGGSAGVADFNGPGAIVPVPAPFTADGVAAGEQVQFGMEYRTRGSQVCSEASLYSVRGAATARTLFGIPAAAQRATDYHQVKILTLGADGNVTRMAAESFNAFVGRAVTMGPELAAPTVTDLGPAPYRRLRAVGMIPAVYRNFVNLIYNQQGTAKSVAISASRGWIGGMEATLAMPDFTGVAGWDNSWAPAAGAMADWQFFATDLGAPTAELVPETLCAEGARTAAAYRFGSF
jgi:hypothetical protein